MAEEHSVFQVARNKVETDIASRTRSHQEKISTIKQTAEIAGLRPSIPYTAIAVGDSWFDYPLWEDIAGGQTDIIAQLELMHEHQKLILRLAHHGDASGDMMARPKQERLIKALTDGRNWFHGKPDIIFCSAGGNDVAGDHFINFIYENDGRPANKGLDTAAFKVVLARAELNYRALFKLRNSYAPGVPILSHTYDFPTPDGRHPSCAGPWLKPSLVRKGWSVLDGKIIIADALKRFRSMLLALASVKANNFHVIDTQGTFNDADYRDDWINELHPNSRGFKIMARKFDEQWSLLRPTIAADAVS
ncbi:SGNH family esterase protein (plasmid) [Rhizobium phaseoli]|uniref:SGNH/GDSL hydrolase family protein n=1 Tax=Rhizobium phaseoli TaxID=396 RepID=UPI0007EA981B|nr:SGNH/GDSL hydrolase family protein [Rhizobium phaseoli]ANL68588.1 SGNH family esterase protein [Rhizobium phaseoli]ANL81397.1 SGNH family esterase protein [Rhizobium phaseoli]